METILVVGTETLVGANWMAALQAAALPDQRILGLSLSEFHAAKSIDGARIDQLLQRSQPRRIVLCGAGARSSWFETVTVSPRDVEIAQAWGAAAWRANISLTTISSDAVFSGPWMFHSENGTSFCESTEAECLRQAEAAVLRECPPALIVRTNAFGWHNSRGWLETTISNLQSGSLQTGDCLRHATPILVTDLIEIVQRAWCSGLNGIYHVAGAERVNPVQFVTRLAQQFQLELPGFSTTESLIDRVRGFSQGETSLQCRKIRRALGTSAPLLNEGLERLWQQSQSGYRLEVGGEHRLAVA